MDMKAEIALPIILCGEGNKEQIELLQLEKQVLK